MRQAGNIQVEVTDKLQIRGNISAHFARIDIKLNDCFASHVLAAITGDPVTETGSHRNDQIGIGNGAVGGSLSVHSGHAEKFPICLAKCSQPH